MQLKNTKHGQTEKRRQTERDLVAGDPRRRVPGTERTDGNDCEGGRRPERVGNDFRNISNLSGLEANDARSRAPGRPASVLDRLQCVNRS